MVSVSVYYPKHYLSYHCVKVKILLLGELNHPDKRKISVSLVVIHSISDHELVRDHKACVIHIQIHHAALRLVKQCDGAHACAASLSENLFEIEKKTSLCYSENLLLIVLRNI